MLAPAPDGPRVWRGPDLDFTRAGMHVLSAADIGEIDRALKHLLGLPSRDLPEIDREAFPLDRVGVMLEELRARLHAGPGFLLLRGLPRERYTQDDMARIFFGLGAYIGVPMLQSGAGDLLGHVIDVSDVEPESRGYRKGGGLNMHVDSTDLCDIIGLMCLTGAKAGGASRISSSLAVYNAIAASRPDLAEVLCRGFYYRRNEEDGQLATRMESRERIPAFAESADGISCFLVTNYIRRAAAAGHPLSASEEEALAEVQRLAGSPAFYLDMSFAPGDIQFLNNRIIFHGRTDYEDHPDFADRRHLMRLWLKVPSWPALPGSQQFSTPEDQRMWARNRRPNMELPSSHLDDIRRKRSVQRTFE